MQLHGPDDWTPDEEREAKALAEILGIAPEKIEISIPVAEVVSYEERQAQRATARGEYVLGT